MKTLTISNEKSNEHSKSVELQGKEIKILTSHCVDTVAAHDLNISRKSVVKRLPRPLYRFCFSRTQ